MNKKVLVISASLRSHSNSEQLAKAFAKGAKAAGNQAEVVSLKGLTINFCQGCLACQKTGKCVLKDDVPAIMEKVKEADVLAFASPVYYYSIAGQLKTLLDRLNPLFAGDYRFRKVFFLTSAHEDGETTPAGSIKAIRGWVDCFALAKLAGTVFAGGAGEPGAIAGHPALAEAERMGRNV